MCVNKQLTYNSRTISQGEKSILRMSLEEFSRSWLVGETLLNISTSVTEKQIKIAAENTCYDTDCQSDKR